MKVINLEMPEYASVKWRKIGLTSLTLLERGEYLRALNKTNSGLRDLPQDEIVEIVDYGMRSLDTTKKQISADVEGVSFIGSGEYVHIALGIKTKEAQQEREKLITILDELNGVNTGWREFYPHISLATIESAYAHEDILKPFKRIMPSIVTLNPVAVSMV